MRVIIAEDEKRASRGLRSLLETLREDIEVIAQASDGVQAMELIKALLPDVVFTDIRMQNMDGLSLIRTAREQGYKTKFVIISAYEEFEYARQALSLDVVDYLVKPVTAEEVNKVLEKLYQPRGSEPGRTADSGALRTKYPQAHPVVLKALDIIEREFQGKINQKELASRLGVTQEYFSYLFTRDIKVNFSRFLRKFRIQKACDLLDAGEASAEEAAGKVGFTDMKYFYKCFKEETGMSLSDYRRRSTLK